MAPYFFSPSAGLEKFAELAFCAALNLITFWDFLSFPSLCNADAKQRKDLSRLKFQTG
jgi:hypothetical protein